MILYAFAQFWESSYKKNPVVWVSFLVSAVLNVASWILLIVRIAPFRYLSEQGMIPLHYNVYFGIDVYGIWYHVFVIPLFGLLIILCNNVLAYLMYHREDVLSYFLVVSQALINIILAAAAVFIVLLNV